MSVARLTISIPDDLIDELRSLAKERQTSLSGAVAMLVREYRHRRMERLMAEGYLALAEVNRSEVEASLPAQAEVVLRD